ncbi:hypothetical protein GOODEAATRI_021917 [Goodea atripinnis]|uniref:Uncharacterized protein n=1 Tax=Goodea atripinnis TaxID=208336 RepID=A0ABV0PQV9_9TELE
MFFLTCVPVSVSIMSREQVSITDLLLSLESSELQEVERVKTAVNQQLSTDRGGAVLSSLVEHYLDSSSSQVVLLLSSIREPHHKVLLEKLNEALNRPGNRLAGVTLLGHLIRKQPPWVHHISQSPILLSLLRCLKVQNPKLPKENVILTHSCKRPAGTILTTPKTGQYLHILLRNHQTSTLTMNSQVLPQTMRYQEIILESPT